MLLIGGFYLVPQLKGAGLTLGEVTGAPYWVGVVAVGAVVALNVALGGMRGITYVQAFQYWLKTFAIALPALPAAASTSAGCPSAPRCSASELPRAPAAGLAVTLDDADHGDLPGGGARTRVDGVPRRAAAGEERDAAGRQVRAAAGTAVPVAEGIDAQRGEEWVAADRRPAAARRRCSSTRCCWPRSSGRWACRTSSSASTRTPTARPRGARPCACSACSALFYVFPAVYGLLGRALRPELYLTGETDSVVLRLPEAAWPGLGGELLGALVAAGAFAAFMSTASGLLVSLAGHALLRPLAPRRGARRDAAAALPRRRARRAWSCRSRSRCWPASSTSRVLVGWAFALAASTFCPLLLLGSGGRG